MASASNRGLFARALSRRPVEPAGDEVSGTARLGVKTKDLVKRLKHGDIAVIAHTNLDRIAAEELIATGVRAVLNDRSSSDGQYPNAGPLMLVRSGVSLVDFPSADLFALLSDGDPISVEQGRVLRAGRQVAAGVVLEEDELVLRMEKQKHEIDRALAAFAENTVAHVRDEGELLSGQIDFPEIGFNFRDRHVLIVVRGTTHRRDLQALRAYIRDMKPILIGVDGGADALVEAGHKPDIILGDMDSASDETLRCDADLIVHAYPDGRAPGRRRLLDMGLAHTVVPAAGTSQDVAMLMAYERGAALIVSVGAHFNLVEFLDKDRAGMSSTFLTRLRIGETLIDAKGVSRLYDPGLTVGPLLLFLFAFGALVVIVVITSPALADLVHLLWLKIKIWLGI